ncbi:hypothetical protein BDZ89DRAFT_388580 [Hymenopellis radicata]|nr:hypothetical protein BDZ89DRAFT_388580 [Hymenopellis radicata]
MSRNRREKFYALTRPPFYCRSRHSPTQVRDRRSLILMNISSPILCLIRFRISTWVCFSLPVIMRVEQTVGALLIGALLASFLSGMVTLQAIIFFKTFPNDALRHKILVGILWALSLAHDACIWAGLWNYIVQNYTVSADNQFDLIPAPIPIGVYLTSICTFSAHCFCAHRIFRLSPYRRWWLVLPILVLAVARMASAFGTASQMIRLGSFEAVKHRYNWMFSLGLALSSTLDILITATFLKLFISNRSKCVSLEPVIDSLILYSIETGAITCVTTITVLIFWLSLNNSLIFLGLHFTIAKLYANSVLATLNMRHELRRTRQPPPELTTAEDDLEVFMVSHASGCGSYTSQYHEKYHQV